MTKKVKKVVYIRLVGDLFHYGHLHLLKKSKALGDYLICGVETDELVKSYREKPIYFFNERRAIISNIRCVNKTISENSLNPSENLKKIYKRFPNTEIILIHANENDKVPEEKFMNSINGKIIELSYDDIKFYTKEEKGSGQLNKKHKLLSTKANTLKNLKEILTKCKIEKPFIFTISNWEKNPNKVISLIQKIFKNDFLIVRSSALNEDTLTTSMAGAYSSIVEIDSSKKESIINAIDSVILSYDKINPPDKNNQILIQKQIKNVKMSGVIFTRDIINGAPYYIINYDDKTGGTDSVTKGVENKVIKISYFSESKEYLKKWEKLMDAINELEKVIPGFPLDIEFAITKDNEVIIFQVRPLTSEFIRDYGNSDFNVKKSINKIKDKYRKIIGDKEKIFSDMAFWNPAEIIGDTPNILDNSLYDYLIMKGMWQKALIEDGYSKTSSQLMFSFGNKPYIDVINAFEFLTSSKISKKIKDKLVSFYIKKLKQNPELHDKIEFEIVYNCYTFSFNKKINELKENGFTEQEIQEIKENLFSQTNKIIKNYKSLLKEAESSVRQMKENRNFIYEKDKEKIKKLLDDCKNLGVFHFSRIARFAFIGKALFNSLNSEGLIEESFYHDFFNSLNTVASEFKKDLYLLNKDVIELEVFMEKYGHLRPGTYNINSPRYDLYPKSFFKNTQLKEEKIDFIIPIEVHEKINNKLKEEGFEFDSSHLFNFIKDCLEKREFIKFAFTKNLSEALEIIAQIGLELGFSREEISKLSIEDFFYCLDIKDTKKMKKVISKIIKRNKKLQEYYKKILLPPIIFSEKNFDIIEAKKAKPNFITYKKVLGITVFLEGFSKNFPDITGKIVLIENADPGFDWIFTKNIAALITKYGGVASHMAIRCAEFSIPAVIGCGEELFNKIKKSKRINLNCKNEKLEVY